MLKGLDAISMESGLNLAPNIQDAIYNTMKPDDAAMLTQGLTIIVGLLVDLALGGAKSLLGQIGKSVGRAAAKLASGGASAARAAAKGGKAAAQAGRATAQAAQAAKKSAAAAKAAQQGAKAKTFVRMGGGKTLEYLDKLDDITSKGDGLRSYYDVDETGHYNIFAIPDNTRDPKTGAPSDKVKEVAAYYTSNSAESMQIRSWLKHEYGVDYYASLNDMLPLTPLLPQVRSLTPGYGMVTWSNAVEDNALDVFILRDFYREVQTTPPEKLSELQPRWTEIRQALIESAKINEKVHETYNIGTPERKDRRSSASSSSSSSGGISTTAFIFIVIATIAAAIFAWYLLSEN